VHVLTAAVFSLLEQSMAAPHEGGDYQLTPALQELARRQRYLALEAAGKRFDIGQRFGLLQAQVALALAGRGRDEALATILETMAELQRDNKVL